MGFLNRDNKEPTKTVEIEDEYDMVEIVEADSASALPRATGQSSL